jgi:hypothetical protein
LPQGKAEFIEATFGVAFVGWPIGTIKIVALV